MVVLHCQSRTSCGCVASVKRHMSGDGLYIQQRLTGPEHSRHSDLGNLSRSLIYPNRLLERRNRSAGATTGDPVTQATSPEWDRTGWLVRSFCRWALSIPSGTRKVRVRYIVFCYQVYASTRSKLSTGKGLLNVNTALTINPCFTLYEKPGSGLWLTSLSRCKQPRKGLGEYV